jgi:hypothetical protein
MNIRTIGFRRWSLVALMAISTASVAATSPVSRTLKFYEAGTVKSLVFSSVTCTPTAYVICIALDPNGFGTYSNVELGSVTVSGSSGRSTICIQEAGRTAYAFKGNNPEGDIVSLSVAHRYEIQSAVLDNNSLINPRTGLPFGGKLNISTNGGYVDQDYMKTGQRLARSQTVGSFDCATPLLNYSVLVSGFGLSSLTAQYLMSQPMTIRLFVSGAAGSVDGGFYSMQLRTMGD